MTKPELLAPAGSLEVFETAIAAGADAVYVGAPALNARNLARDLTLAEIAAMREYASRHRVKLFIAMNSLVKEEEIPLAARTLAILEELEPDGLIVQDLGVMAMARRFFPKLRLHASTLLGAHNSMAVQQFADLGFSRVVLARELSLKEITQIRSRTRVELEVFVHGALCYSYSGLCLFSSALGGKSGLRGRCVQPCRRRYTWLDHGGRKGASGMKGGYLFSMSDLSAIGILPQLCEAGVASMKIEGRLRSARYVGAVVRAYRLALDSMGSVEEYEAALVEAEEILKQAMGRRTTSGFFLSETPSNLLSPGQSGNIGLFLGKIKKSSGGLAQVCVKEALQAGDRLRLHQEASGERLAFSLKSLQLGGREVELAPAGATVMIGVPGPVAVGDTLFKVDSSDRHTKENELAGIDPAPLAGKIHAIETGRRVREIIQRFTPSPSPGKAVKPAPQKKAVKSHWWLRLDNLQLLRWLQAFKPDRLVVFLDRETARQHARSPGLLKPYAGRITWALPPVIHEKDLVFYRKTVEQLLKAGNTSWQLGHLSQTRFFAGRRKAELIGAYTLNILNSQALAALAALGCSHAEVLVETDRRNLEALCGQRQGRIRLGITVYGALPLFTARLSPASFQYNKIITSPKGEQTRLVSQWGLTLALPELPFSLLAETPDLAQLGLDFVVVDLSHQKLGRKELEDLEKAISGRVPKKRQRTFNYHGTLL